MQTTIQKLKEKIKLFQKNLADYKNKNYDEYSTRADFIDFVFSAFGWDMYNEQGVIEQFREVIREDKIEIEGRKKAPDYSFRIGQQIIFYVEAKRPSVDIKNDPEPAYQLRRYAYTQGLKLSILTDFEEIAVYDTRVKPEPKDKAGIARIFYCTFNELFENTKLEGFETNFDFLFKTFSKQAILTGSFNQYAEKNKNKKGTEAVDKQFLNLLDTWRKNLAIRIALKNENLDEYHLNIAVQKIIDRLIFLRIAEDRLIEKANLLQEIANESNIFGQLLNIFKKADKKYNSGLFISEEWLKNLSIEDKALKSIIEEMYYPKCPYEFSVLPLEILGQAYEQFLGKTIKYIRKTKYGHKVKIEEKPEVRKAGGVYYTPQYIVNYIVKNTVGEKLKKKNPDEIAKLKILDPACGSGSFLIGAYDHILRYYLKFYLKNETRKKKALKNGVIYQTGKEKYKLSTGKKSEILVNNIYGVDIDNQAVEVTKLSLLLKVLEDENLEYREQLFKAEHHHLLPDLSNNIKCGNSLIGSDFYEDKNLSLFDNNEMRKINTFDWDKEFADIFESGGFDCVIGNPPYFNIQTLGVNSEETDYIMKKYSDIWQDKSDILFYFIYKAISVSNDFVSFIVSNAFLFANKAQKLRNFIIENANISKIVNFEKYQVFSDASITTAVIKLNRNKKDTNCLTYSLKEKNYFVDDISKNINNDENYFEVELKKDDVFALIDKTIIKVNKKIDDNHSKLNEIFKIGKGMETAANKVFTFKEYPIQFKSEFIKKRMSGKIISKYFIAKEKEYLLYFEGINDFEKLPLSIQHYLFEHKNILENRADKKRRKTAKWWNYSFPMHKEYYHLDKIWCSYRAKENIFCFDDTKEYIGLTNTTVIFDTNDNLDLKYLLALLNSKVLTFRYKSIGKQTGNGVYEYFENGVGKLPILAIDNEKQKPFINLVDQMLETQKKLHSAQTDSDKKFYKQKSNILDKQIDKLVYGLYELNDEEIKIITN